MSFTEKRLLGPTQLTTSASSALYTVPTSKSTIIKQIVVTNTTASSATFTFYIGATASASNALFSATQVAGNDSVVINLSQVMSSGETIRALASANTTLNITVSGVENDGPLNPLSSYIADGAITTAKIATGAVITEDIANNAVTQAKLASNLSGITVTTSTLRATVIPSPFEGQMCYETDTDKVLVWNGSAWYPNWNLPWGYVDSVTSSSTQALTGSFADITSLSKSMSLVQNRRYKVTMTLFVSNPSSGVIMVDFKVVAGSTSLDTFIMQGGSSTANRSQHIIGTTTYSYTGATGSVTVKGQALYTGTVASLVSSSGFKAHEILVEDIGPA